MHQIQLLKKYGLSVRGARGQHLLIDENIQRKFVSAVNPQPDELILEIGPGLGAITELLLKSGPRVIAVEHDERFVEILKGELGKEFKKFTLIHDDILKFNLKKHVPARSPIKVVGNIPYYITSPILLYLISFRNLISSAYLTVQREIANRFFAQPGTKEYGRLSLLVRLYADASRKFEISRNCFSPKPDVDSTVVELNFRKDLPSNIDEALILDLIKAGFGERRKTILNAITNGFKGRMTKDKAKEIIAAAGLEETVRAENLMLKDFIRLAEEFSARKRGGSATH
jgi:16S rRNA (adenine1518-N6/adenine1519-N6)-dimethyltransferase